MFKSSREKTITSLQAAFYTFILLLIGCQSSDSFHGTEMVDIPVPDFTLTDQNGQPFTLSEHKGEIVLMFFGFTYCPDVCPLTLSTWKKVQDALQQDEAEKVKFVYITVDPQRDTQEKLKNHLSIFSPDFIGLRGTREQLDEVYSGYGVYREKVEISESATGYLMNHTSTIYVIDQEGKWRLKFSNDAAAEDIVHDIQILLSK